LIVSRRKKGVQVPGGDPQHLPVEHGIDIIRPALEGSRAQTAVLQKAQEAAGDHGLAAPARRRGQHDAGIPGNPARRIRREITGFHILSAGKIQLQAPCLHVKMSQRGIQVIEPAHGFVVQHLRRLSAGKDPVSAHTDYAIRDLHGQVNLMQGHHNCDSLFARHPVEDGKKLQLVADIQIGGRLVENDDLRVLADGAGQQDPLALAVAHRVKGPVRQLARMHGNQGFIHLPFVLLRQDTQPACVWIAAHRRNIPAGHQLRLQAACQDDRHPLRQLPRREAVQFFQ